MDEYRFFLHSYAWCWLSIPYLLRQLQLQVAALSIQPGLLDIYMPCRNLQFQCKTRSTFNPFHAPCIVWPKRACLCAGFDRCALLWPAISLTIRDQPYKSAIMCSHTATIAALRSHKPSVLQKSSVQVGFGNRELSLCSQNQNPIR